MNHLEANERVDSALTCREENTRQRLERFKQDLQKRMDDINQALALLEKYPDMELLTDLLRRI